MPFGTKDAQFHLDIGFFVFTLPWLRFIVGFLTMVIVLALIAAAVTHYLYGGLQLQSRGERTTTAARVHLSLLLAALVLVRAASYWLDRYALTTEDSRLITGLTYTDVHAVMPAKAILAVAALIVRGAVRGDHLDRTRGGCRRSASACSWSARSWSVASTRRSCRTSR